MQRKNQEEDLDKQRNRLSKDWEFMKQERNAFKEKEESLVQCTFNVHKK